MPAISGKIPALTDCRHHDCIDPRRQGPELDTRAALVRDRRLPVLTGTSTECANPRPRAAGKPVAAINLGRTRADAEFRLKLERPCGKALVGLVQRLMIQTRPRSACQA